MEASAFGASNWPHDDQCDRDDETGAHWASAALILWLSHFHKARFCKVVYRIHLPSTITSLSTFATFRVAEACRLYSRALISAVSRYHFGGVQVATILAINSQLEFVSSHTSHLRVNIRASLLLGADTGVAILALPPRKSTVSSCACCALMLNPGLALKVRVYTWGGT